MRRFTEGDTVKVTAAAANHRGKVGIIRNYCGNNNICCVEFAGGYKSNFLDTSLKLITKVKKK